MTDDLKRLDEKEFAKVQEEFQLAFPKGYSQDEQDMMWSGWLARAKFEAAERLRAALTLPEDAEKVVEDARRVLRKQDYPRAIMTINDSVALNEALDLLAPTLARVKELERELSLVDEALSRRPALASEKDRYSKICLACSVAGKADQAERELAALKRQGEVG